MPLPKTPQDFATRAVGDPRVRFELVPDAIFPISPACDNAPHRGMRSIEK